MRGLTPVRVAIWDSGTDVALFPQPALHRSAADALRSARSRVRPALVPHAREPLPADRGRAARVSRRCAATSRASRICSSRSTAPRRLRCGARWRRSRPPRCPHSSSSSDSSATTSTARTSAGIAVRGNPAARIVVARITFDHKTRADAALGRARAARRRCQQSVRRLLPHARRSRRQHELGRDAERRRRGAREERARNRCRRPQATRRALLRDRPRGTHRRDRERARHPVHLRGGKRQQNSSFNEDIPASIRPPEPDRGRRRRSSRRRDVVHQLRSDGRSSTPNGYQVESPIPGGTRVRLSGTSMASPNVVNLAAKLFALDPTLRPADVIRLIRDGATTTPDGRRHLIDPEALDRAAARSGAASREARSDDRAPRHSCRNRAGRRYSKRVAKNVPSSQ